MIVFQVKGQYNRLSILKGKEKDAMKKSSTYSTKYTKGTEALGRSASSVSTSSVNCSSNANEAWSGSWESATVNNQSLMTDTTTVRQPSLSKVVCNESLPHQQRPQRCKSTQVAWHPLTSAYVRRLRQYDIQQMNEQCFPSSTAVSVSLLSNNRSKLSVGCQSAHNTLENTFQVIKRLTQYWSHKN